MILEFFLSSFFPLLDVRSPCEYQKGHIPHAKNLPLFSDEERALIGTLYKQKGKEIAIKEGLRIVGPKLSFFVSQAEELCGPDKKVRLYCARGGLRSSSMAWLLTLAGFSCQVLDKGYKAYRKWTLEQFIKPYSLFVLGGLTGSGKTALLHTMQQKGWQVLDVEQLANHKGSSFGHPLSGKQPSVEHFENLLASTLSSFSQEKPIWVEDESRMIGTCPLPRELWHRMGSSPFFWLTTPLKQRVHHLVKEYGSYPHDKLAEATIRLTKRIGREKVELILNLLQEKNLEEAAQLLLGYYDTTYLHSCQKRGRSPIPWDGNLSTLEVVCPSP